MANTTPLRFAAFDLDGTLIDSAGSIVDGVLACWADCGFPEIDPEDVRRIIGLPWETSVKALLPSAGEAEFAKIRTYYEDVRSGKKTRPPIREVAFDGAHDILDVLEDQGYLLGLVTSRSGGRLQELLESHNLEKRFLIHKTADMGPGKPNPHLLIEAMNDLGVEPANTVMIGDTTFDIMMGVSAGTGSVGVSWGVHEVEELHGAGAHHVVDGFHELPTILDNLTGK